MRIDQAVIAERARYVHINMLPIIFANLAGGCITSALFLGAVAPIYFAMWAGFFAVMAMYWVASYWRLRGAEFTPETADRLFRLVLRSGIAVSIAWGIGFYFFYPTSNLVQQFAMFCAVLLFGISTAICFASYYPAFLGTFLPFALSAVFILATHQPVFYPRLIMLSVFIPLIMVFARHFNRLLNKSLQLRFENIELVAQLTVQKEIAESAVLAKSRFLAAASHDLRQPTHALGLFIATLQAMAQRTEIKGADVAHIATRLQTALNGLGRLLNSLLDVSRLDAGAVEVRKQPVSLTRLYKK